MNVSVIGATGYTGFELVKMLSRHSSFKIASLTSESYAGQKISDVYPALSGICDIVLTENDIDKEAEKADAFFLCLPHKTAMEIAKKLYNKGKIVLDLSADFRISDAALYEKVYKTEHTAQDILPYAVYGHAELFTDAIKKSRLIAVPGCYPTSIITPLYPLIENGLIDVSSVIADSKSGVSGAGRKATMTNAYCETNEDFKPYGIFGHRHNDEINHILERVAKDIDVVFTPHLLPVNRGILSTIYVKSTHSAEELTNCITSRYAGRRLVRFRHGATPTLKDVANTAFIDIAIFKKNNNIIIVSAIDNLLKGASAQALQCLNIIVGQNETDGLI